MMKALEELNVAELRRELKERQLNPKGTGEELRERLDTWLIENGHDVDEYEFVDRGYASIKAANGRNISMGEDQFLEQ